MPTTAAPHFLTPEDLAEMFNVPKETVYQWRRKRTGPPGFRVGRHLRYDLTAVLAWVAKQTQREEG
ncbi:helix-turn-helix domain-containing protein [Nonomuraea diastatica]|uniref:DNA-binding protein n=1 Tax=Nonomuraea diastatica TaxID=1848329 RepID=A0A4R4WWZ7_9ACTN|nr:helix-turn-helix domain-containing protein [Nonomuraea diastatica]TDD22333.1 DNA-binding protein [Nonomuraea diastatica]